MNSRYCYINSVSTDVGLSGILGYSQFASSTVFEFNSLRYPQLEECPDKLTNYMRYSVSLLQSLEMEKTGFNIVALCNCAGNFLEFFDSLRVHPHDV